MKCKTCDTNCIKAGKQINGQQRYYCKTCKKHKQENYRYLSYDDTTRLLFSKFSGMGCGVRKIAGFLEISINTVQKWISRAMCLNSPGPFLPSGEYDIDEIQTYAGRRSNRIWVTYGWHVDL